MISPQAILFLVIIYQNLFDDGAFRDENITIRAIL